MPTSAQNTFVTAALEPVMNPEDALGSMIDVAIGASLTLVAGTVLGQVTAGGKFKAYASGNSDGSQVPKGILRRAVTTDSSGNINNQDVWGSTSLVAQMYTQGYFRTTELTGLDANAVTLLSGALISGSVADGILRFG